MPLPHGRLVLLAGLALGSALASPGRAAEADRYGDPLPAGARARIGTMRLLHPGLVYGLAYAPDGKTVASAGADGLIRVWDVQTGKAVLQFGRAVNPQVGGQPAYGVGVNAISYSPDGKVLAAVEGYRSVRLWDPAAGKELRQVTPTGIAGVYGVTFSPDGKKMVALTRDKSLHLFDVESGKEESKLDGHQTFAYAAAFAADGKTLVSGSDDLTIRLWDLATGKEIRQIEGHRDAVRGVALSPDGKLVGSVSTDGTARVWEAATGKELQRFTVNRTYNPYAASGGTTALSFPVAFLGDGKMLAAGYVGSGTTVWDVQTGKELRRFEHPVANPYVDPRLASSSVYYNMTTPVAFTADGQTAAVASADGRIRFVELATGRDVTPVTAQTGSIQAVAVSPDGKTLAVGGADKTVYLWDLATGKELQALRGHVGSVGFLAFGPDGKTLISASLDANDKVISVWDLATGKEQRPIRTGGTVLTSIAASPDGSTLVTASQDGLVRVWDVAERKERFQLRNRAFSVTPTADGKSILCWGQDGLLRLYDAATGQELRTLIRPNQPQRAVGWATFSPDGKLLASTGLDGIYRLWDAEHGKELRQLGEPQQTRPVRVGGQYLFAPAAFAPDGRTLALLGRDNSVQLWEMATGKERFRLAGHQGGINSLAFSPDGGTLVTGSADATVLVWDARQLAKQDAAVLDKVKADDLDPLWDDLAGDDAKKAYRAVQLLGHLPRLAVPFLKERLRPENAVDDKRIDKLIADLDSEDFQARKVAQEELEKLSDIAEPALRRVLATKPSLEVSKRLEQILQKVETRTLSAEQLRGVRAVEALERLGTAEAQGLLRELAKGAEGARLTRDAKAALGRLDKVASN